MKIKSMGINYTHSHNFSIERPMGSGDYLLLLIKTPACFLLNGRQKVADRNSVIIYNINTPQFYSAYQGNYSNDYIHFEVENERDIRKLPLDLLMALPSTKQVTQIFKEINMEYISNNASKEESIDLMLKLLFVKINELAAHKPLDTVLYGYYDVLLDLRSQIYRHPDKKWSVAKMAGLVNLSTSHFQRLYKKTFGISCITDVISCKIEYAKISLAATGGTIREISALCGYENEEHFMRQFKRIVGITPSEYRKQLRD